MARVLILEPHPEVRELLARIVRRLGHEAWLEYAESDLEPDVVVVEPADERALALARTLAASGISLVCVSIFPSVPDAGDIEPVAYLLKPFTLVEFEHALASAIARVHPATAA